jgi:hypothetical protein
MGFVVDKVALGPLFSEYFGFPCQSSFHQLLHNHPHLSSGAGTIDQKWPQYKGLSPTPLRIMKRKEEFSNKDYNPIQKNSTATVAHLSKIRKCSTL